LLLPLHISSQNRNNLLYPINFQTGNSFFKTWCTTVLLVMLAGCAGLPMVTSRVDPVPFQESQLNFIEPGKTTTSSLVQILGKPTFVRKDGQMLVYASAINVHNAVLVGAPVSQFDHYFLFIDLAGDGTVESYEIVSNAMKRITGSRPTPCRLSGECVEIDPWIYKSGAFSIGEEVLPENLDIAVLTDTLKATENAKSYVPGPQECAIYIWGLGGNEMGIRVSIDNGPWRAIDPYSGTFILRRLSIGMHRIMASYRINDRQFDPHEYNVDCQPVASLFAQISAGGFWRSRMKFELQTEEAGRNLLKKSRLVLE